MRDWNTWTEYLYETFKMARLSLGWPMIKEAHDDEDVAYFQMLEGYRKQGLMEVRSWDIR